MRTATQIAVTLLSLAMAAPAAAQPDPPAEEALHPLIEFSIAHSNELYPSPAEAGTTFAHEFPAPFVVLSRVDVFADSLAASVLLRDVPMLFTEGDALSGAVEEELARLLPDGGTVYVLGGTGAISGDVIDRLRALGHSPERIAGQTRIETSLAIADLAEQLFGTPARVALARASGPEATAEWADAIAAAPWSASRRQPILLTTTDELHPAVAEWIADRPEVAETALLGGEAALSAQVEAAVPDPQRFDGPNRFATAVSIADELYTFTLNHYRIVAADHPDGWGYALAGAGMAVEERSPILLVGTDVIPAETADRLCAASSQARITVLGDADVVSQAVRDDLATDC